MARPVVDSIGVRASRELAWAVLTDYDLWPEWVGAVHRSQVLVREGEVAVVELVPAGDAHRLLIEVVEIPGEQLRFTEVGRYGGDEIRGRCDLTANPDGQGVRLQVAVELRDPVWRRRRRRRTRALLPQALAAWAERCQRVAATPFAADPSGRFTLLEVERSGDELIVQVGEQRYVLREVPEP